MFPNIVTARHIFVGLPASVFSGGRILNVLNRLRTVGQDLLSGFSTLSMNCDLARRLALSSTIKHIQRKGLEKRLLNKTLNLLN
jgi:hypothetical protein